MIRLWPRSLTGQVALVIALALFVAQAINLAMVLRERAEFRLAQATRPTATRIADALEQEARGGRPIGTDRGRIRRVAANPIPPFVMRREPEVAIELRRQLIELGIAVGRIDTGHINRSDEDAPRWLRRRGERQGGMLRIAVEQPGKGWLTIAAPWRQPGPRLLWVLLWQTAVIYVVVLAPVLLALRRIARPLGELSSAARGFTPTRPGAPVEERGPQDVRDLIAAFNTLRLRVVAMLDEKDRMLGALGHDLRTPLAALRVRIESVDDDADRTRMAATIDEMNRMLDDILSLARVGRAGEPPTPTDLSALVDVVVEDFRDLGADVAYEPAARAVRSVRPAAMKRAVRNLIENAVKYAGAAEVSVAAGSITVADRGPGIPADRLADVFEPFTRLESSRNRDTGGSGLGLALAQAIVTEAGGTLTLANRDGGGLAAVIALPG